ERGARLARRRYDAGPDGRRWLRSALLPIAARTDEESDRTDEIAKGTNLVEDVLRHHDRELALERQRQLDEVERIGGKVVTQRDVGDELLYSHTEALGDETPNMRLHEFVHAPRPQTRGNPSRCTRQSTTRPASRHYPPSFAIAMSAVSM